MGEHEALYRPDDSGLRKPLGESAPSKREAPLMSRARIEAGVRGILKNLPASLNPKDVLVARFAESFHTTLPEYAQLLGDELRRQVASVSADDIDALIECVDDVVNRVAAQYITREELELRQREHFLSHGNLIPLSEALAFGTHGTTAHIHLAPASSLGIAKLRADVDTGLRELARRLQEEPELQAIQTVEASSWIVAKNPRLIERLGFTVDGLISEEVRERYFHEESRPVASAHMSREDLLERYGSGV